MTDRTRDDAQSQAGESRDIPSMSPTLIRCHIIDLEIGEPFAYQPGGPAFCRVGEINDPIRVARIGAPEGTPAAMAELCYVYRIAPPEPDHDAAERSAWARFDRGHGAELPGGATFELDHDRDEEGGIA